MSDNIRSFTAVVVPISLLAIAVVHSLLPRHPREDMVQPTGRRLNIPVASIPPSGAQRQPRNPQAEGLPNPNHLTHSEDPVTTLPPPSPPPNYVEYVRDPRIDGTVPSYGTIDSARGSTVNVVPPPNQATPPASEDTGLDGSEEGADV